MKVGKEDQPKPHVENSPDAQWYAWDNTRGTRVNQDYQREVEDAALNEMSIYLGKICEVMCYSRRK